MHIGEIRDHCLAKPGVTEGFPFGGDAMVFMVMNKERYESVELNSCKEERVP